jgi:hypothetical protein
MDIEEFMASKGVIPLAELILSGPRGAVKAEVVVPLTLAEIQVSCVQVMQLYDALPKTAEEELDGKQSS